MSGSKKDMVSLIAVARGRWRWVGLDVYRRWHSVRSRYVWEGGLTSMVMRSLRSSVRVVDAGGLVFVTAVPGCADLGRGCWSVHAFAVT